MRFDETTPKGGISDQDVAVFPDVHHRRHHRRPVSEGDELDPAIAMHGGRGERRAEIDPESVRRPTHDRAPSEGSRRNNACSRRASLGLRSSASAASWMAATASM